MDALDLGRSADVDDINAAFREASKTAHPDAGGSPDRFAELQRSRAILLERARASRSGRVRATDRHRRDQPAPWLYGLAAALVTIVVIGAAALVLLDSGLIAVAVTSGLAVWLTVTIGLIIVRQHRHNVDPTTSYARAEDVVRFRTEPPSN